MCKKIDVIFSNKHTIKIKLKNNQTKPAKNKNKSGVYKINCEVCDGLYIGQTRRRLDNNNNNN